MIEIILKHWNFTNTEIFEQLNKDSLRLIYKIKTDGKLWFVTVTRSASLSKGISNF